MTSLARPIDSALTPDDAAWETLRGGLAIMALRRTCDADTAAECVQEILARTLELVRTGRVPTPGELVPIAFGIARHVLADEHRKRARSRRFLSIDGSIDPPTPDIDVLAPIIAREEQTQLSRAWRQLSSDDRDVLRLSFVEAMEPGEIARRLGEPAERVRKRKSRALSRLREKFFGVETADSRSGHVCPVTTI